MHVAAPTIPARMFTARNFVFFAAVMLMHWTLPRPAPADVLFIIVLYLSFLLNPKINSKVLIFFLLILAGRVFGAGFGFALGAITLFTSALITSGVGPWLPYQMLAAGFVGFFAGWLPPATGAREIRMLAVYGVVSAFVYGWLMDFSFWPFALGEGTQLSFDPNASVLENLHRFVLFNLATSMGWNLGRAITNALLILVVGGPVLRLLRRSARRANFTPIGATPSGIGSATGRLDGKELTPTKENR